MVANVLMVFDLSIAGEAGLIMFLLIFLAVAVWTFTRSTRDVEEWSEIPLEQNSRAKNQDKP